MGKPCGDGDLAEEALRTERGRELGPEPLEGDPAVVFEVVGEVHRAIPPAPSSRTRR